MAINPSLIAEQMSIVGDKRSNDVHVIHGPYPTIVVKDWTNPLLKLPTDAKEKIHECHCETPFYFSDCGGLWVNGLYFWQRIPHCLMTVEEVMDLCKEGEDGPKMRHVHFWAKVCGPHKPSQVKDMVCIAQAHRQSLPWSMWPFFSYKLQFDPRPPWCLSWASEDICMSTC